MTPQSIEQKLLIKPKKIEIMEGEYKKDKTAKIYTNARDIDMSYLLELAGYQQKAEIKDFEGFEKEKVLLIGDCEMVKKNHNWVNDEEYLLTVSENGIFIIGKTDAGMLQGLKAVIRITEELGTLPKMFINDYPDVAFRAVHTCVFRPDDGTEKEETSPEDLKRMIKTAAISGYNHIFIEFWGMFPYSLDYAHWPNAYTRQQIEDVVSYAMDKCHIRPLPAQNLTSHAGWSRIVSRKHTVLDQRPDLEDMYIPGGWCFATENPKTKEFIKLLIDELVETFRNPPYLHACCDKAFGFGSTEEDRTMSADVLFAKHISFLNSYLREKDVTMVMWGDMLYSSMDALYWKCSEKTADFIPKNILINIWTHNDPGHRWQDAEFFANKGFDTVCSPFMQEKSIESMVSICREKKSYGVVQTTWHRPQSAVPYVILSGALQWCGEKPEKSLIKAFSGKWYV